MPELQNILSALSSGAIEQLIPFPIVRAIVVIVKIIMGAVGLFLLGFITFVIFRTSWRQIAFGESFTELTKARPFGVRRQTKKWNSIVKRLKKNDEGEYKLAILEADELLLEIFKRFELRGENPDEQLDNAPEGMFPERETLKEARRVRNNIVHDADYPLSQEEALQTLHIYEQTYQRLDLI